MDRINEEPEVLEEILPDVQTHVSGGIGPELPELPVASQDEMTGKSISSDEKETTYEEQDELLKLRSSVDEYKMKLGLAEDRYLRKQAELENFRKRMLREKSDAITFANKQLLLDIVDVIDNLERAVKSAGDSKDFDTLYDGIVLIEKQFIGMLERKWGLKRFDSQGDEFDPQRHEAVYTEKVEGQETPMVVEDYQKGYFLYDKILRSAKVKVSLSA